MSGTCLFCNAPLSAGRFCPACGAEQLEKKEGGDVDPLIGRILADRYEIQELINAGGMGRVYRGRQRALERKVAIKFVHAHLAGAEAIVSRFLVEAQTASRLNHPNVVSIFDFGRTPEAEGGLLYLVMELLSGPDLAKVLDSLTSAMPFKRVVDILCQTLGALGEAHALGITHRDVKPENILLETKRTGGDLVKVIDFGIAKLGAGKGLTQAGQVVGTPYYMAPEQASGKEVGPSVDLYAVGAVLFEMLTGRLLFDGPNPGAIMAHQLFSPRPDPREVAPEREIPDALAEVCLSAIAIDPDLRFPDAESFAEALVEALPASSAPPRRASIAPPAARRMASAPDISIAPAAARRMASAPDISIAPESSPDIVMIASQPDPDSLGPSARARAATTPVGVARADPRADAPVGTPRADPRADTAASAPQAEVVRAPARAASVRIEAVRAPSSRAPAAVAPPAAATGTHPRRTSAPRKRVVPPPIARRVRPQETLPLVERSDDVAWARGLLAGGSQAVCLVLWGAAGAGRSRLLRAVADAVEDGGALAVDAPTAPPPAGEVSGAGLRRIIPLLLGGGDPVQLAEDNEATPLEREGLRRIFGGKASNTTTPLRRVAAAAFEWAARLSLEGAGRPVVLLVDDIDHLDGASRTALNDLVVSGAPPRFHVVTTSLSAGTALLGDVHVRRVKGLSPEGAAKVLAGAPQLERPGPREGGLEPLYLEQLLRWHAEEAVRQSPPRRLAELVEWRIRNLPAAQRRTLQAIAVVGGGTIAGLSGVVSRPEELVTSIEPLAKAGFVATIGGRTELAHAMFGEIALAIASPSAVTQLHAAAAGAAGQSELRAHHAIHGLPAFEAFLAVEECARARAACGDEDGVIAALKSGQKAARAGAQRGDVEATSGCVVFGQKLGAALIAAARLDEAAAVLGEVLGLLGPQDDGRAALLEQLATIADARDRRAEAEAFRREALALTGTGGGPRGRRVGPAA
jgi:serine/threonine protein kinase